MKIKQFSHTDLDGVGSYVVLKSALPADKHEVSITYCDYHKIDEKVVNFTKSEDFNSYDFIVITDISVNEETAIILDEIHKSEQGPTIQLLDHHGTAEWLNKYEWAHVDQNHQGHPGHKSSGTSLVVDFLDTNWPELEAELTHGVRHFAETVRRYDTWEWARFYNEILPKELNDYLYMTSREEFANLMIEIIPSNKPGEEVYFDTRARALLDQKQKEIEAYIKKKSKQLIKTDYKEGVVAGVVFADQHVSELGNELCKQNEDIDFVIMIDMGERKLSFRTAKDDVDVSEIAKTYGGGGHPKASGAQFSEEDIHGFLSRIL